VTATTVTPERTERQSLPQLLSSEWTKIWTIRSTVWTLLATVGIGIGLAPLVSYGLAVTYTSGDAAYRADFDPVSATLQSLFVAQLAIGVLGVMAMTNEYATGLIQTSLACVPHRTRLLWAKVMVFIVLGVAVGEVIAFPAFFLGEAVLSAKNVPHHGLTDAMTLRAIAGYGLYIGVIGLLGLAIGVLLRSTAGSLAAHATLVFIIPVLSGTLPDAAQKVLRRWWPSAAGARIVTTRMAADVFSPWGGFLVLCVFVAIVLAAAFLVFRRRDV
jgi:ABC-type transport system involved in multi-copper enzyme maturation permease subunit